MPPKPGPRQQPRSWREGRWRGGGLATPQPFSASPGRERPELVTSLLLVMVSGERGDRKRHQSESPLCLCWTYSLNKVTPPPCLCTDSAPYRVAREGRETEQVC